MVRHVWVMGGLIGVIVLTACGQAGQTPSQPTPTASIRLLVPVTGTPVLMGAPVDIRGEYSGSGIVQVRVNVNGVEHAMLPAAAGAPAFTSQWVAQAVGQTIIFVEALDADKNVLARSDVVAVQVSAPLPTAVPVQQVQPQPATVTVPLAPTPAATVAATGGATATLPAESAAASTPSLTVVSDFANLRAGPGTTYDLAGRLNQGQTATVTGKSADGQWWQASVDGKTVWIFGQLVQANAAANGVAVAQAPPLPTSVPATAVAAAPTATPQAVAIAPAATPAPAPTAVPAPAEPVCNAENPFWAARLNNNPEYTFCTPVPFEFVFNASPDPDEMIIRWHIYGDIQSLEMRLDPSGDSCGQGSTGFRQQVQFKEDNFRLNRRSFPPGGYKLGLWATMNDGRVQDWGELHFCGAG
jgi:uncharacterized protein YraI